MTGFGKTYIVYTFGRDSVHLKMHGRQVVATYLDVKLSTKPWVTHGTILRDLYSYLMGRFYISSPLGPPWKAFTLARLT